MLRSPGVRAGEGQNKGDTDFQSFLIASYHDVGDLVELDRQHLSVFSYCFSQSLSGISVFSNCFPVRELVDHVAVDLDADHFQSFLIASPPVSTKRLSTTDVTPYTFSLFLLLLAKERIVFATGPRYHRTFQSFLIASDFFVAKAEAWLYEAEVFQSFLIASALLIKGERSAHGSGLITFSLFLLLPTILE